MNESKTLRTGDTWDHGKPQIKVSGSICRNRHGQHYLRLDSNDWIGVSVPLESQSDINLKSGQFENMYVPLAEGQILSREDLGDLPVGSIVSYEHYLHNSRAPHNLLILGGNLCLCSCYPNRMKLSMVISRDRKVSLSYLAATDE